MEEEQEEQEEEGSRMKIFSLKNVTIVTRDSFSPSK